MNNKDLALLRKEFKLDSYALPIKEVYSIYLKKDNSVKQLRDDVGRKYLKIFLSDDTVIDDIGLETENGY